MQTLAPHVASMPGTLRAGAPPAPGCGRAVAPCCRGLACRRGARLQLGAAQRESEAPADNPAAKEAAKARAAAAKKASGDVQAARDASPVDDNIGAFCSVDRKPRSLGEKEQDFLLALQSFYDSGKPTMSNEEFDLLKQELLWEGSQVAILSKDEQRFLEASLAFNKGTPVLSDAEYDALKQRLKASNSPVALAGPRCSLRSQRVYSDSQVDYLRMTALNVPGALVGLAACFVLDDASGFRVTELVELPEPYGLLAVWGLVLPAIYLVSAQVTGLILKDSIILQGPCPNCGAQNVAFFGTLLTVEGESDTLDCNCPSCKSPLNFQRKARTITLIKN